MQGCFEDKVEVRLEIYPLKSQLEAQESIQDYLEPVHLILWVKMINNGQELWTVSQATNHLPQDNWDARISAWDLLHAMHALYD